MFRHPLHPGRFSPAAALLLAALAAATGPAVEEPFFPSWAERASHNRPLLVRDTGSALGRLSRLPKTLTLKDIALVHGHLCDGLAVAWVELGVALRELFPDGIVDRTDLRVVTKNGPCWVDAAAWMTGARLNHGTLSLDNRIGNSFVVQRMSSGRAVRVQLREGVFPRELADLEAGIRGRRAISGGSSVEEIGRFERLADDFSRTLLNAIPEGVVEWMELPGFDFPGRSVDPIAVRSDVINRHVGEIPQWEKEHGP